MSSDAVMTELRGRVRERLRQQLLEQSPSSAIADPEIFADVERLLAAAATAGDTSALLLPEVLGDAETWRLQTAVRYQSHRAGVVGPLVVFLKRRLLMPAFRWLFEYSRDNFDRQRRVNLVLFACVQELAAETARLRRQLQQTAGRE